MRRCRVVAAAADSGEPTPDAGAAFLEQFKSLSTNPADILGTAQKLDTSTSSSGCCGGSSSAPEQSGSGCCGGSNSSNSSGAAGDQQAASAVMNQLSNMMGGMDGSLTRDDFRSAFDDTQPDASAEQAESGERFLDVSAILSSRGQEGGDDYDEELDALVV
ncbi:hypothetical protein D9Q98_008090 [Chlorella vulgaris]|uniref:Uncharacterized protein n=1 Tax=Chlorella vulgaris TaxID=3077 RepID=A0A9D4TG17_CHLVU|nr:hypothetical protein D9Q98_008090 [Chlorella vulgaris]